MLSKSTSASGTQIGIPTSQKIINDLTNTDDIDHLRDCLRDMLDSYLVSENDIKYRRRAFDSFKAIDRLLFEIQKIEEPKTKVA